VAIFYDPSVFDLVVEGERPSVSCVRFSGAAARGMLLHTASQHTSCHHTGLNNMHMHMHMHNMHNMHNMHIYIHTHPHWQKV
jgi:hypothetical protein